MRKDWKIGYKVVQRDFKSWSVRVADRRVTYVLGKETRPPKGCGPLAVFATQRQAVAFIRKWGGHYGEYPILRVRYTPSKRKVKGESLFCRIVSVWENSKVVINRFSGTLPVGTRLATIVIPINISSTVRAQ